MEAPVVTALRAALGDACVLAGRDIGERYREDVLGNRGAPPLAVVRPASTAEVSRALAICNAAGVPVVSSTLANTAFSSALSSCAHTPKPT